ncbi:MAG TPA: hypothetical protein VNZ49_03705 [Bacteroidia bacterium]|jgi:hypothetical protein|nr:hypothetical protein [Bacteroidia bacterium]
MVQQIKKFSLLFTPLCLLLLASCGNNDGKTANPEEIQEDTNKVVSSGVLNIGGELFSIPSPLQTAMLIQKTGSAYDKSILNTKENMNQYATDFSKALNLGIYGADLGYVSMYNKTQDAISYLAGVKKLSDDLGLSGAFDTQTMERFNKNISNKDSMMMLVGLAYRSGDAFLKNNKRSDISGLILAGGWIESLYFALQVNKAKENEDVKRRVADQKQAITSIIKLLSQNEAKPEYTDIIKELKELGKVYDSIQYKYVYEMPETDVAAKITTINSHTDVSISKEQLDKIIEKVESIRKKIVNPVKA